MVKRLAGLLVTVLVAIAPAGLAGAVEDGDTYAKPQPLISINAVACEAREVTGTVTGALSGSTVSLKLVLNGAVLDTTSATAGSAATFALRAPIDRFGGAIVTATGTDLEGNPFEVSATVRLRPCPDIPTTGNSGTGEMLRAGGGALLLGGLLVTLAMRRRRATA
jgi:hypothetical protein